MKYIWYGFLGLFSLGFLGLIGAVAVIVGVFSYYGKDLPDYSQLKDYQPPIVTRLYAGDGNLLAEFAQEKRVFTPIENVPDIVKHAFISAEDQNFYEHEGVDIFAIVRAAVLNLKNMGSRPKGASTITQQVAKNFLLTNEVRIERKIKEAILAYRMEKAMSKDRLLELYLNEIFLGSRAYGVAAAALQYFNKSLDELTIAEAAYLAALPKAPNNYHPVRNYEAALGRRNWVIGRMLDDGYIEEAQADLAKLQPLEIAPRDDNRKINAPFFAEEVRRVLADQYGEESLYGGGLAVRTTIDPKLQRVAQDSLRAGLMDYDRRHGYRGRIAHFENESEWLTKLKSVAKPRGLIEGWRLAFVQSTSVDSAKIAFADESTGTLPLEHTKWARKCLGECYALGPEITAVNQVVKKGDVIVVSAVEGKNKTYELQQIPLIQGALVAMDPHTGRVLAMSGGWSYEYGVSEFNRAVQAKRQPGSAFKPFVYLAALDKGFTPATLVLDAPFAIEDRPGHFWSPTNYSNEYYGPTPIRVGVEKSRNLMTVRLADFLGMDLIAEYAARFGIMDDMPPVLSMSLGAGETTLFDITTSYAVLVNGGKKVEPTLIDRIQDRHGATILRHDARPCVDCGQLIKWQEQAVPELPDTRVQIADPRTSYQMVSILEGVVQRGTGARIRSLGRPLAGKTGTTNESKDTWFVGFSPDLVVGVFAGFDEPRSLGKRETGSSVTVPIFKDFMEKALEDEPVVPFRTPPGIRNVQINAETGVRAQPGDEKVIWESFLVGTEPTDEMYILDGRGINLMPTLAPYDEYGDQYYYGDEFYGDNAPGQPNQAEGTGAQPVFERPPPIAEPITGTGGIY